MDKKLTVDSHLAKEKNLDRSDSKFGGIEYQLQLALGSTTAVVKNIWHVEKTHLTSRFEKRNNSLILESWIPISSLQGTNSIQNIIQKGFDIDKQKGKVFETGRIKLQPSQNNTYKFLLVRISVGKSYFMFSQKFKKDHFAKLPSGFDSIYLYQDDSSSPHYRHDYIVFRPDQILPCYEVHFEFDPKRQQELSAPICQACGKFQAVKYCLTESASFCLDCDNKYHDKQKIFQRHKRVDIKDKPKPYGQCLQHPTSKLELYCLVCNQALCVYCKIKGNHKLNNHEVVKIEEVYDQYKSKSHELDPSLQKRKNKIVQLLSQLENKMKEVNKNATSVQNQLYDKVQKCFKDLQDRTYEKLSYIVGDQLQLRRQFDQIQWAQSFLKYQRDVLLPSQFLTAWNRHSNYRKELVKLGNIPVLTAVKADLKIDGQLKVVTESLQKYLQNERQKREQQQMALNKDFGGIENNMGSTELRKRLLNKHIPELLMRGRPEDMLGEQEGLSFLKTAVKK